jgi:SAM-dependent methyltransferase
MVLKRALWPLAAMSHHLIGLGFATREVGRMMRQYWVTGERFLDVGCGSMELYRYVPGDHWYNGLDLSYSEFQLRRMRKRPRLNIALASATAIPLEDNCVSMVAATEVLEHIPAVDDALAEIRRVLKPQGKLLCSIPNNYYHKYQVTGENPDHVNKWTFDEFEKLALGFGFSVLERRRMGYWIPLKYSYPVFLPLEHPQEYYCAAFIFAFELKK